MLQTLNNTTFRILIVTLAAAIAGCASHSAAPPLTAPQGRIAQTHFLGSVLTGAQSGTLIKDAETSAFVAQVHLLAARDVSMENLHPFSADARLVIATRDRQPVLPVAQLTAPIRWQTLPANDASPATAPAITVDKTVKWQDSMLAIPRNVTASIIAKEDAEAPSTKDQRELEFYIHHLTGSGGVDQVELAIGIIDQVQQPRDADKNGGEDSASAGNQPLWQHEVAVLQPIPIGEGVNFRLVIPLDFANSTSRFAVAVINIAPAPQQKDPAFDDAMKICRADVERESKEAAARLTAELAHTSWSGFDSVIAATADVNTRRAAMVYLATQTGAIFSRDVYLVADPSTLQGLLQTFAETTKSPTVDRTQVNLAWLLDQSTLEFIVKTYSNKPVPPELASILTSFAGQAGRDSASIQQVIRNLHTRSELQSRLISENMIALEDGSPAARVRAYDWLGTHGKAPAGYDPLGEPVARRTALEKASSPATAP